MMALLVLGALSLQQELPPLPAEFKVNTNGTSFYAGPSRTSGIVHQAKNGDAVMVTESVPPWLKCDLGGGKSGFVKATALIAKDRFQKSAATEAEVKAMAAQGQEAQRGLNPTTEAEHRRLAGPQIEAGYVELDELMKRPSYRADRAQLESRLAEFRKAGKLGEFGSVK